MGNFESSENNIKTMIKNAAPTEPTVQQINILDYLVKNLIENYGISYVGGHRDYAIANKTLCPGETLYTIICEKEYYHVQ